jgi:transcription termination/antitermination protein NusA
MPANDLLDHLLAPSFELRVVRAEVVSATSDVARISIHSGDAMLPASEWYQGTRLPSPGTLLQLVQLTGDTLPVCSATSPELPRLLFEAVTPEIRIGDVRIMGVARAPGKRTKIAVAPTLEGIDPIASCVGRGANRVKYVSAVLSGERLDVVAWHPDPAVFAANALAPASVAKSTLRAGVVHVEVPSHQVSAAVGAGGQNSALASRLVGLPVNITAA